MNPAEIVGNPMNKQKDKASVDGGVKPGGTCDAFVENFWPEQERYGLKLQKRS